MCRCKGHSNKIKSGSIEAATEHDNYKDYQEYNFIITMENKDINGYISEKIMNAFLAGSIPIYWGTKYVKEIFNEKAFVYVNDFSSLEECAKYIVELNNDKERMKQMVNEPVFKNDIVPDYYKVDEYDNPSDFYIKLSNKVKDLIEKANLYYK
jgi:hypothetical protein